MKIVTRIAPSPTGYLHFGLARTALFNYLFAKKHGGEFVIRIEDTDVARNKQEFEDDIRDQLTWLGLDAGATYRQSEHRARHKECLARLIGENTAYISKEPAKDDASRFVEVVRLRNPGETITFKDGIRGDISFDTTELKDFVIARSINEPLYHFAVVVDDQDEGVTHVIRGDDHISNTPRQILILKALGCTPPKYTHLPLILMPDKSKMSKRKHESSVRHFREQGILPDALINYIANLGWTPPSGKEIFSEDDMVQEFELSDLHKSGAVFDIEKLRWYNREYLQRLSTDDFARAALPRTQKALQARNMDWNPAIGERLLPLLRERTSVWSDIETYAAAGELDFFFNDPTIDPTELPGKGSDASSARKHLAVLHEILFPLDTEIFADPARLKDTVWDYATEAGRGAVLWPMRFSLSGLLKSPDPFTIASILGKESTLRRLKAAEALLNT